MLNLVLDYETYLLTLNHDGDSWFAAKSIQEHTAHSFMFYRWVGIKPEIAHVDPSNGKLYWT